MAARATPDPIYPNPIRYTPRPQPSPQNLMVGFIGIILQLAQMMMGGFQYGGGGVQNPYATYPGGGQSPAGNFGFAGNTQNFLV